MRQYYLIPPLGVRACFSVRKDDGLVRKGVEVGHPIIRVDAHIPELLHSGEEAALDHHVVLAGVIRNGKILVGGVRTRAHDIEVKLCLLDTDEWEDES